MISSSKYKVIGLTGKNWGPFLRKLVVAYNSNFFTLILWFLVQDPVKLTEKTDQLILQFAKIIFVFYYVFHGVSSLHPNHFYFSITESKRKCFYYIYNMLNN